MLAALFYGAPAGIYLRLVEVSIERAPGRPAATASSARAHGENGVSSASALVKAGLVLARPHLLNRLLVQKQQGVDGRDKPGPPRERARASVRPHA
jgi:hypothetical protein